MTLRRILAALACGAVSLGAGADVAAAAPVSLTATYSCNFPLLDPQPVKVTISSDIPTAVGKGETTPAFDLRAVSEVPAEAARALRGLGARTIGGTASASASLTLPGGIDLPLKVPVALETTDIPASGGLTVVATGQTPPLTFSEAGVARIDVGDLVLTLSPRLVDGTLAGTNTFESECAQDPGQNRTLTTIQVGDGQTGSVKRPYLIKGTSAINTLTKGPIALKGRLDTDLTPSTGAFAGDLALDRVRARLMALGIIPITADVQFVQTQPVTGTITGGGATATARFKIRVAKIYLFGSIPIAGGENCQTKSASVAALTSAGAFDPVTGGRLTGTYAISDLTGCGALNAFLSPLTKGGGNTLDLTLTQG